MTETVTRWLPAVAAGLMLVTSTQAARAGLARNWEESGVASWYGPRFDGRRTSSGQRFDQNAMTAAHDTLPLGTRLCVTMQETGRSVVVVVTDRMPPKHVRVIDLSRGAARQLGIIGHGTGMVTLTEAKPEDPVEVAEAPDDDEELAVNPRRHGPRHRHPAARRVSGRH
jgi:rare lipoprotein A